MYKRISELFYSRKHLLTCRTHSPLCVTLLPPLICSVFLCSTWEQFRNRLPIFQSVAPSHSLTQPPSLRLCHTAGDGLLLGCGALVFLLSPSPTRDHAFHTGSLSSFVPKLPWLPRPSPSGHPHPLPPGTSPQTLNSHSARLIRSPES